MPNAIVIDGNAIAEKVRREVEADVARFREVHGRPPGLHVVIAGDDPASAVYVRNKEKAAKEIGIAGEVHRLPADVTEEQLVALVRKLNFEPEVDGILVQLPLPKHIRADLVLDLVDPAKDVDGFHPVNAGLLSSGRPGLVPCTPTGCIRLIDEAMKSLEAAGGPKRSLDGARAVVVGRSNIVGKPVAQLLLARNATVTIAHSRTKDLPSVCREADVLVVAVGRAQMITGDAVKEGAIVIDVGMNRIDDRRSPESTGKSRLCGDVDFESAKAKASAITPVPRGVGPMTIAYLLRNTVDAGNRRLAASHGGSSA
jgi:methylenetetrahydrofolate dehydrogenase (NADP+) / methenyltetrahydrofolate cyclohydrolase